MAERRVTYGARRRSQVPVDHLIAGLAAHSARVFKCSRCTSEVVAYVPMHDGALRQASALGLELEVICFECTQTDPSASAEMKATQRRLFEGQARASMVAETDGGVEILALDAPVIPSKVPRGR
jgi:hypothetical protein